MLALPWHRAKVTIPDGGHVSRESSRLVHAPCSTTRWKIWLVCVDSWAVRVWTIHELRHVCELHGCCADADEVLAPKVALRFAPVPRSSRRAAHALHENEQAWAFLQYSISQPLGRL
eukprot:3362080-Prymnesium_polylepis.2